MLLMKRFLAAAKLANVDEIVAKMPDGYEPRLAKTDPSSRVGRGSVYL